MQQNQQNEFLSVTGAAKILDVAAQTVRDWERRGRLRAMRTETGVRIFSRAEVERLAAEQKRAIA
jgi:excisionase family DNA binding protein